MKVKTLLIRELGERNLYQGLDYITIPIVRDMKMEYKGIWYIIISIVYEINNYRIILVRKFENNGK